MQTARTTACLLALALIAGQTGMSQDQTQDNQGETKGVQSAEQFERVIKLDYLLALPDDYDSRESWPLVLFLHGAGERGNDVNKVKIHGPPKLVEAGQKFPFILVSPQCPAQAEGPDGRRRRGGWDPVALTALLDDISARYHVDANRVYVTGLSMGGYGTWALAAHTPYRFAAIAPICGGGNPDTCGRIAAIPAWVFHGAKDNVVPIARSEDMVNGLKAAGAEPKFTVYPDAQHDSWTETYNNPELFTWLLSHSLEERK